MPKYDPPYAKRQMMKGYSHPNSPHPSQLTPDHTFDGGIGSKMSLTGISNTQVPGPNSGMIPGHPGGPGGSGYPPGTPGYRPLE